MTKLQLITDNLIGHRNDTMNRDVEMQNAFL